MAQIEFCGTDGHRLSVVTVDSDLGIPEGLSFTIPAKALRELERMVGSFAAPEVQLTVGDTQVLFDLGAQRLTTRLLEGQYPNYRKLLPKQFARQVTVDRRLLMLSLERIAVLASQKNDIVKIAVDSEAQSIAISADATEVGSGREDMPARITGDGLDIAFNVRYLLDGLKAMDGPEVVMHCNAPTSPAVFEPVGGGVKYLVMPCQIRGES